MEKDRTSPKRVPEFTPQQKLQIQLECLRRSRS